MNEEINPKEASKRIEKYLKKVDELLQKSYKEGNDEKQELNTIIKGFLRAAFKDDDKKIEDYKRSAPIYIGFVGKEDSEEEKQEYYLNHLKGIRDHLLAFKEELELIIDSQNKEPKKIKDWDAKDYIQNGGMIIVVIGLAFASLSSLFNSTPYLKGILDTLFLIVIFIIIIFSIYKYLRYKKMDKKGVIDWRVIGWAAAIVFGLWLLCKLNIFCIF